MQDSRSNRCIFYEILDLLLSEIIRRFSDNNKIIEALVTLLTNSKTKLDLTIMNPLSSLAKICDTDVLKNEVSLAKDLIIKSGENTLFDICIYLLKFKEAFINIFNIYKVSVTLGVSTARCEA